MTDEQITRIEAAIADCERKGLAWTNLMIYEQVGGKYGAVSHYLKQRRARQATPSVLHEPEPLDTRAALDASGAAEDASEATIGAPDDSQIMREPDGLPDASLVVSTAVSADEERPLVPSALRLTRLQQAAREADERLIRLTYERDQQVVAVQRAAIALHQAQREATGLLMALR